MYTGVLQQYIPIIQHKFPLPYLSLDCIIL